MSKIIKLLKKQKEIEINHAESLKKSLEGIKHPLVAVLLESIIHDSKKHADVCKALINIDAGSVPFTLDVDMASAVNLHQDIKKHIMIEKKMIQQLKKASKLVDDDRVVGFLNYLIEEEKRHHEVFKMMSNLIDRDTITIDEYLGLFQKYMIVSPE
jgi:rubrerythrin